jgi:hypothetical protein
MASTRPCSPIAESPESVQRAEMEAALYLDDQGALTGEPLFEGAFTDASRFVWAMKPDAWIYARIETPGRTYSAAELESMRKEDEGEI